MGGIAAERDGRDSHLRIDSEFLLAERRRRGLSQPRFADMCGISVRRLRDLEAVAEARVQSKTVTAIADRLKVPIESLTAVGRPPEIITSVEQVIACNIQIVEGARHFLYATGSRSRDTNYLESIERSIGPGKDLAHMRILFGPPRTAQMATHLANLITIKNNRPTHVHGNIATGIAMCVQEREYPMEASICMNEKMALYVLASFNSPWAYDCAAVFHDKKIVTGWKIWIETMFRSGRQIVTQGQLSSVLPNEYSYG